VAAAAARSVLIMKVSTRAAVVGVITAQALMVSTGAIETIFTPTRVAMPGHHTRRITGRHAGRFIERRKLCPLSPAFGRLRAPGAAVALTHCPASHDQLLAAIWPVQPRYLLIDVRALLIERDRLHPASDPRHVVPPQLPTLRALHILRVDRPC
jgi:hypothetical protein